MPDIAAIVPTYNSGRTIMGCLASLREQTSPCAEVLVVDRFSSDGTPERAKAFGATVIQAECNRSAARNLGLTYSTSAGVLFVDSDMITPPTLVEECESGLRKHQALILPEISMGRGFWAECKSLERQTYVNNDLIEAARCFQREALLSLGGYDPSLEAGEDWDLQNRAEISGFSFGRVGVRIIHDENDLTLVRILRKKYKYGKTINRYLKKNPRIGMSQIDPLHRVLGPNLRVLASDPVHGAGVAILKTLEYVAAAVGLLKGSANS